MTMTPEQQNIVGEAMNLLIQDGSSGMADFFRRLYEVAMQLERQQFMNAAPYQPKFSSWGKVTTQLPFFDKSGTKEFYCFHFSDKGVRASL